MKIGIDISQTAFEGTGVAEYTKKLVETILKLDAENEYLLFFAGFSQNSIRRLADKNQNKLKPAGAQSSKYSITSFRIPLNLLEFLWNRLHIIPIEWLIGKVDVFFTSDWLEPPAVKAKKITTIHDLSIFKTPESFDKKIIEVHKRKLQWVKKESDLIICDSLATKKDAMDILGIEEKRLRIVYPGGGGNVNCR